MTAPVNEFKWIVFLLQLKKFTNAYNYRKRLIQITPLRRPIIQNDLPIPFVN